MRITYYVEMFLLWVLILVAHVLFVLPCVWPGLLEIWFDLMWDPAFYINSEPDLVLIAFGSLLAAWIAGGWMLWFCVQRMMDLDIQAINTSRKEAEEWQRKFFGLPALNDMTALDR